MDIDYDNKDNSPKAAGPNRLDGEIRDAVRSVESPPWLKESLLGSAQRDSASIPRPKFKFFALAAILVIGLFGSLLYHYLSSNNQLDANVDFRQAAAAYIADEYFLLDFKSESLDAISRWIGTHHTPTFDTLPKLLLTERPIGCKALTWRNETITLICFHRSDGTIAHLFIGNLNTEVESMLADLSTITSVKGLETGGWSTNQHVFLLTGSDPSVEIEDYLKTTTS